MAGIYCKYFIWNIKIILINNKLELHLLSINKNQLTFINIMTRGVGVKMIKSSVLVKVTNINNISHVSINNKRELQVELVIIKII